MIRTSAKCRPLAKAEFRDKIWRRTREYFVDTSGVGRKTAAKMSHLRRSGCHED